MVKSTVQKRRSEAGQEEMKLFLAKAGIADKEFHLVDGSGLSRLTLVTPAAITNLLVHMYRPAHRDEWIAGTIEQAAARLNELQEAGLGRAMLRSVDHADLELIDLLGRELVPLVA